MNEFEILDIALDYHAMKVVQRFLVDSNNIGALRLESRRQVDP